MNTNQREERLRELAAEWIETANRWEEYLGDSRARSMAFCQMCNAAELLSILDETDR